MELRELVERARLMYEQIDACVFACDPVVNRRLRVEILEPAMAGDTPTFLLVSPWTVNGLAFPPDGRLPASLMVDGKPQSVLAGWIPGLGPYRSVNLVRDVSRVPSPAHARKVARMLGASFRQAVARARLIELRDDRPLLSSA